MRRFFTSLVAACALAAMASPAAAVPPDRYPGALEDFVLSGICPFGVDVEILVDKTTATDFYDQDGNLVRTNYHGRIVIRLTNLADPDVWIEAKVGGPGRDVYNADGTVTLVYLGRSIPIIAGSATETMLTRGNFQYVFSGDFETLLSEPKAAGHTVDFCALLTP
jgi:hypothetical protein